MAEKHARDAESAAVESAAKRHQGNPLGSREFFLEIYDELKKEIIEGELPKYGLPKESIDYMAEMMDYNVPGGKLIRGLTVVHVLQAIKGADLTREEAKQAAILGWCIEWLQAFFLVADDVMDDSITRRGQPCWYRLPKVGMVAINDGFLLQAHLYKFLHNHFKTTPHYVQLVEVFTEVTWQTELGQLLDLTSQPAPAVAPADLERFTLDRYKSIVKYKTAYYTLYLPVACGLIIGGLATETVLKKAEEILVVMGEYFQIQDDYLDCYADPETLGKIGTDIQDNKCSWLVVQALQRTTPAQKDLLKAHYGKKDDASVAKVKELYRELDLERVYLDYEENVYQRLKKDIAETCAATGVPEAIFLSLLHKLYKRSK